VLFEFAKIKSKIYGFTFNFKDYNDPELLSFIKQNRWYFYPPLEKASEATALANGTYFSDKYRQLKLLIKDPR